MEAEQREKSGIEKMLVTAGIQADKREKKLVTDFFALWEERRNGTES